LSGQGNGESCKENHHARDAFCELQLRRIRLAAHGQPLRVRLCHCTKCRKESGAPFTAIFCTEDATVQGDTASWKDTTHVRHFCPSCGSSVFGVSDGTGEIGIRLGAFDVAPTNLVPTYELWIGCRERWLPAAQDAAQFTSNRP
jgi:hypothetical protein